MAWSKASATAGRWSVNPGGLVCAAGCATGRPALIVPYPHHKDRQQTRNAEVLAAVSAAVILEEADLTPTALTAQIHALLTAPAVLAAMGQAARTLLTQDATAAILADMGLLEVGLVEVGLAEVASSVGATTFRGPAVRAGASRREASA